MDILSGAPYLAVIAWFPAEGDACSAEDLLSARVVISRVLCVDQCLGAPWMASLLTVLLSGKTSALYL